MKRVNKFIANRTSNRKKLKSRIIVSDAEHLTSAITNILEKHAFKHNTPSIRRYYFNMADLPRLLEELYPQDFREHRNAGIIRNRPLTGRISELENVKKAAFTAFIGKIVAPEVIKKAGFNQYGKYGIEMVLKRIESGASERNYSKFNDKHGTMPQRKPMINEEDMSNKEFAEHLNKLSELVQEISGNQKRQFEKSEQSFAEIKSRFDTADNRFNKIDGNFNILFDHLNIPSPK